MAARLADKAFISNKIRNIIRLAWPVSLLFLDRVRIPVWDSFNHCEPAANPVGNACTSRRLREYEKRCSKPECLAVDPESATIRGRSRPLMRRRSQILFSRKALYPRSLDIDGTRSYDLINVEVREFTFNRCPYQ